MIDMEQRYKTIEMITTLYSTNPEKRIAEGYHIIKQSKLIPILRGLPNYEMQKTSYIKQPTIFTVYRCNHLSPYYVEAEPLFHGGLTACERYAAKHNADGIGELFKETKNAEYIQNYLQ